MLTRQLPAGSATNISLGSDGSWTPGEHLAATAIDVLQIANWQRGGGKGEKPKRLTRPGEALATRNRQGRIAARAAAYKRRQRRET